MRMIHRLLFSSAAALIVAASASAQGGGGGGGASMGGGSSGGGGGNFGGGQNGGNSNSTTGLPFGSNGAVGVTAQSFQSASSGSGVSSSNVLGGYYANPMYQGRVGTTGGVSPGGFGSVLYSTTSSTGGMAGGGRGATGGTRSGGITSSSFGSSTGTGFGSSGAGGGRSSTGGFGGTSGSTGGFGSSTGGFGGTGSVGAGGGFGGGMGGFGGGGMNGQSQNTVMADRRLGTFIQPSNIAPATLSPLAMKAQVELRGTFQNSTYLASGKSITVNVTDTGIVRLRGNVSSDDERKLAISLAQMTPGVNQVVSELTVQPNP
ncbi:MAG: BON domain-containing protein [Gemmataceae bacterium]